MSESSEKNTWICSCGAKGSGVFCGNCGCPKPNETENEKNVISTANSTGSQSNKMKSDDTIMPIIIDNGGEVSGNVKEAESTSIEPQNEDGSKIAFCPNCGRGFGEDEVFCSSCGNARNVTVSSPEATDLPNGGGKMKEKKKMGGCKKAAIIIAAIAAVLVIGSVAILAIGGAGSTADFQTIYDKHCQKPWAKVGSDGSYLTIDTNPYDKDDGDDDYELIANIAVGLVNKELGFSDSLYEEMCQTSWSMGKQTETKDGITVSWTYHPNKGLEVTYKKS